MKFRAEIDILPVKEIPDPQGKAVKSGLARLGLRGVENVRIGKHILLELEADNEEAAKAQIEDACKRLLANLVMEDYSYHITEA